MSDRIHHRTANSRPNPLPAIATSLSDHHTTMFTITQHTNRRTTTAGQAPNLTTWESNLSPTPLTGIQSCRSSGTADQLPATTRLHFDIMDLCTGRNRAQRHAITKNRLYSLTTLNPSAGLQTLRGQNICQIATRILNQSDPT